MPPQRDLIQIVHSGAAEGTVGDRKAGRLDDMRGNSETGAEPQNRPGILRNVGLVEGKLHGALPASGAAPIKPKHRVG